MGVPMLWALSLAFCGGVFLRSYAELGFAFCAFALLLAAAAAALALQGALPKKSAVLAASALVAFSGGVLRMEGSILSPDAQISAHVGERVVLEGVVFAEPDAREESVRLSIRADALVLGEERIAVQGGVLAVAPFADAVYGDRVRVQGVLALPERFGSAAGREFDYPGYLAKDGILYRLSFAEAETIGTGERHVLKAFAISVKQWYLQGLHLALPEPHSGLAGGITAGDKRGVGEELGEDFRAVGLTHIIVLSGYNIMIVIEWLGRACARASAPRAVQFLASIFVAVFFALMTGLASASVRAAAMASIAVVGRMTRRMYIASRALALVAALMVLWNPYLLVFDPGFQLSILATAGLILFAPPLIERLRFVPSKWGLREVAATTLATQLTVLPLLLYQTGQLPVYGFFANLAALAAVPFAMLFSAIAALGGLLAGPAAPLIALPAHVLLSYIIAAAEFFASLPYASLELPAFGALWLVLVYGGMVVFALTYERVLSRKG